MNKEYNGFIEFLCTFRKIQTVLRVLLRFHFSKIRLLSNYRNNHGKLTGFCGNRITKKCINFVESQHYAIHVTVNFI